MDLKALLLSSPNSSSAQFLVERERHPEHLSVIDELEKLFIDKLYHQFTEAVLVFLKTIATDGAQSAEFLYNVIYPLRLKLNTLSVCKLVQIVVDRLDFEISLILLGLFEPAYVELPDAYDNLNTIKAKAYLKKDDLEGAGDILFTTIPKSMSQRFSVEIVVNADYQWACVLYYRASDNPEKLYNHLLLYLAYTPLETVPEKDLIAIAFELCVCGLISQDMFDFGELRLTPAVVYLENVSDYKWILEVVDAAVEGSLDMFEVVLDKYKNEIKNTFGDKLTNLSNKMLLVALLELAFQKPKNERRLTFQEICLHCKIPMNDAERLVMKAMSFELIKGKIDGITEDVKLNWVKPRMVGMPRVCLLRNQFETWTENVRNLTTELETAATELLAV